MLFASTDLAARIERAECNLIQESAKAIARDAASDVVVQTIAGGVAAFTGPDSPLNKVAGLGFGGPIDPGELEALETTFRERGAPVQVELSNLADPGIGAFLTDRGYVLRGFENVLGRALAGDRPPAPPTIEVRESGADELEQWIDVVVSAFLVPDVQGVASHESFSRDVLESVIRDMATADGFHRYLARLSGDLAGGASMRMFDGVAQLCGAATLPEKRRQGVQTALLASRLDVATRGGCDVAVVTTQPGSKSHENVQRRGFELLYTRAILVKG